jgi:hypothetical protein
MKAALVTLVLMSPVQAHAIDMLPQYETAKVERVSQPAKSKPKAKKVVKRKAAPRPKVTPVAVSDDVTRCLPPVRVVGSQDVREGAAEESAKKGWAEAVRWAHGEAFMNIENAQEYKRMCSRSSIGEALGAVLNRCEVIARPCRTGMSKGDAP